MLQRLFGHDPQLLLQGEIDLGASVLTVAMVLIVAGVIAGVWSGYFAGARSLSMARAMALWLLRASLLGVLFLLLLDPAIRIKVRDSIRGGVAVLLDDSASMRLDDGTGVSRATRLLRAFDPKQGAVALALEQRFDVDYLSFSSATKRINEGRELSFHGARSNVAGALSRALATAQGEGLAGVVLVSDGGGRGLSTDAVAVNNAVAQFKAAGVILHVVGIGAQQRQRDLELAQFDVAPELLRGDAVEATVAIEHAGYEGATIRLVVEEEGTIAFDSEVTLGDADRRSVFRVPLKFNNAGPRKLLARIDTLSDELNKENNLRSQLVNVSRQPIDVLHIEGEPRFEVKFLRRAIADDDGIRLRSLVRTAENKFYRLGVDDEGELAHGLPNTEVELFRYHAVVLGSVGEELLDPVQQRRLQSFVARRGGGLIMLGGRSAFAEGGYAKGALAQLSPVVMPPTASQFRRRIKLTPTAIGARHPLLRIGLSGASASDWSALPTLTMVNPIRMAKPGATVIFEGDDGSGESLVALAWHRYGHGSVVAFPVRDTWRWQMHSDIPLDDQSHELLWRQLLRHVARPALHKVQLYMDSAVVPLGDLLRLRAHVFDAEFIATNRHVPHLELTTPGGSVKRLSMTPSTGDGANYESHIEVHEVGRYGIRLKIEDDDGTEHSTYRAIEVSAVGEEFHAAIVDKDALQHFASQTGGHYFSEETADQLPASIGNTLSKNITEHRLSLRAMPVVLLVLLALACLEWLLRRRSRLP